MLAVPFSKKGLSIIFFISILTGLSCGRQKKDKKPKPPEAEAPPPAPSDHPDKMVQGPETVKAGLTSRAVALSGQEELDCDNMCGHMAFCNRHVHGKETSVTAFSACIKSCGQRRSKADRSRWEAMEECLKQHPGEACGELRSCIERRYGELQKRLHMTDETKENTP